MKDQNKNQKAPETKLTDAQLGEVNAGKALATVHVIMTKKAAGQAEGQLGNAYCFQGKVDAAVCHLLGRD